MILYQVGEKCHKLMASTLPLMKGTLPCQFKINVVGVGVDLHELIIVTFNSKQNENKMILSWKMKTKIYLIGGDFNTPLFTSCHLFALSSFSFLDVFCRGSVVGIWES
jgi:hypothetical protein